MIKSHWRLIQVLFVGLAFLMIGLTLYANWSDLSSFDWELNYLWFIVSLLLVSVAVLSLAAWWTLSIRLLQGQLLQGQLGWRQGTRIWAFAQLAKYLPGGIWNYASRVYACDRAGVSKSHTALSLAIETVLRVQAAIIVFLASLPFWPTIEWSDTELLLVSGVLLVGFLALDPHILNRGLNLALRMWQRPPVNISSVKYWHILALLVGHVLTVAGVGGAFYLMVLSVYCVPSNAAFPMAGMLAISVISGFLNPLTPHGLGTREGLLILLLNYYLPLPAAVVISLLSRLWLTVSELVGILISALIFRA